MNALININKYTEDNQLSKKLQPASQQLSQFMSSAPTLILIFIATEYDLAVLNQSAADWFNKNLQ